TAAHKCGRETTAHPRMRPMTCSSGSPAPTCSGHGEESHPPAPCARATHTTDSGVFGSCAFAAAEAVHIGGVEEVHALIDGRGERRHRLLIAELAPLGSAE